jgi:hypothetical protein
MKARVTYTDPLDGSELIAVGDHSLQFGGPGGGYCYEHQTFDCYDNLTDEEWKAIKSA